MIVVNLDVMLAKRKVKLKALAEQIGITPQNLSVLKSGRTKAIRFSTLDAICRYLDCQTGDILEFSSREAPDPGGDDSQKRAAANHMEMKLGSVPDEGFINPQLVDLAAEGKPSFDRSLYMEAQTQGFQPKDPDSSLL